MICKTLLADAPFGNIMNWNDSKWELSRVEKKPVETNNFCPEIPEKTYKMFPERRSLEAAKELCEKVGNGSSMF